jgi:type II secretory pathway pseudopilin PulG
MRFESTEKHDAENGFVLLAVLLLVALVLLGLAVAAPRVAKEIQRDKELEFYHRGTEYSRAIRLYYRKTGGYPTDLSQLEDTNNIRFLRKRYLDPITGKPFRIIHQGEAKAPMLGLFGQPLAVQPLGASPTGNPIGSPIAGAPGGTTDGSSLFGSSTSSSGTPTSGSSTASSTSSDGSTNPATGTTPGASSGATGTGTATPFGSTGSTNGTTVIGRIVGVSSTSPKESIRVYKKQTHYNQWEFVYDPASETLLGIPGVGAGQTGLNAPGSTTNPSQSTTGVQTTPSSTPSSTPAAPE